MSEPATARPETQRLFVGVGLPDHVRSAIGTAIEPLRSRLHGVRWVPLENVHLTLAFLGSMATAKFGWVEERLGGVAGAAVPVATSVTGLGGFPSAGRARVVWLGLDDPQGRLRALALAVQAALAPVLPREPHAFTPHLTVARSPGPLDLERLGDVEVRAAFVCEALTVFRSHLGRPAPVYEPVATLTLGRS